MKDVTKCRLGVHQCLHELAKITYNLRELLAQHTYFWTVLDELDVPVTIDGPTYDLPVLKLCACVPVFGANGAVDYHSSVEDDVSICLEDSHTRGVLRTALEAKVNALEAQIAAMHADIFRTVSMGPTPPEAVKQPVQPSRRAAYDPKDDELF